MQEVEWVANLKEKIKCGIGTRNGIEIIKSKLKDNSPQRKDQQMGDVVI